MTGSAINNTNNITNLSLEVSSSQEQLLKENEKYIWSIYNGSKEIISLKDKLSVTTISSEKNKILSRIAELEESITNDLSEKEKIIKEYRRRTPVRFTE